MACTRYFPYEFEFVDDLIYLNTLHDCQFTCDGDNLEVAAVYEGDE